MWRDERSGRVAIVSDALANGSDALAVLAAEGWGAIVLPPGGRGPLLDAVVDEVDELVRNGMTVVALGDGPELGLPRADPGTPEALVAFLREHMNI